MMFTLGYDCLRCCAKTISDTPALEDEVPSPRHATPGGGCGGGPTVEGGCREEGGEGVAVIVIIACFPHAQTLGLNYPSHFKEPTAAVGKHPGKKWS